MIKVRRGSATEHEEYAEHFIVDGNIVPRRTEVSVNLYSILNHRDYFLDPFAFRPERWLDDEQPGPEANEARAIMRQAHISFGIGERSCPGKTVAYTEA